MWLKLSAHGMSVHPRTPLLGEGDDAAGVSMELGLEAVPQLLLTIGYGSHYHAPISTRSQWLGALAQHSAGIHSVGVLQAVGDGVLDHVSERLGVELLCDARFVRAHRFNAQVQFMGNAGY